MRRCLQCDATSIPEDWTCPSCGFTPSLVGGFQCFAPELAGGNSDYDPKHFEVLVHLEDGSFWFLARNRLILWALSRFFATARSLMEIGVGTGFVMRAVRGALPEARLWASDAYVEGLRFAAQRLGDSVAFLQMDARRIPFRNEFEVICLFDVLEHIQDDEAVLNELRLALKPGGGLIITVPQHMFLWGPFDEMGYHKRRYAIHELEEKVKAAGFEVLLKTSFVSLLLPVLFLSRLRSRRTGKYDLSDEQDIHPMVDKGLRLVLACEFALIRGGFRFPAGGSQLLVARLPKAGLA
jgi:ubiquinone/menaquinone biosynthesis C-methylase UbiE